MGAVETVGAARAENGGASCTGRKSQRGSEKLGEVEFWKWRMENEKGIKGFVL